MPAVGVECAHAEGGQRGRLGQRQQHGVAASTGDDLSCGLRELGGAVAGVAPDDHTRGVYLLLEPIHETGGGAHNHGLVHAGLAEADLAAQPGGAELQGACEGLRELSLVVEDGG